MAHLLKSITQGVGIPDPRLRSYHVYKCNVCGHEQDYNHVPNFDTDRLRKCNNCGVTDDSNDNEYILQRQQFLEQKIASLEAQTQALQEELTTVQAKLKTAHVQFLARVKETTHEIL